MFLKTKESVVLQLAWYREVTNVTIVERESVSNIINDFDFFRFDFTAVIV